MVEDKESGETLNPYCLVGTGKTWIPAFSKMTGAQVDLRKPKREFIGFVSLHPNINNPLDELKKRQQQGFAGIGECHPWVQGLHPKIQIGSNACNLPLEVVGQVTYHDY